jgi:anti-anti-sigma factor
MAAELTDLLLPYLQNDPKNIVLNLKELQYIDVPAGEKLVKLQQKFYETNASLVICELQKPVESTLDSVSLLEMMNCTPTEAEAGDIVLMEEIERDLLDEPE